MRKRFASIFACMLALVIALSPLLCFCAVPSKATAESVPACHRKHLPQKQQPADCSHCEASEIAKRTPDSPIKPAPIQLVAITAPIAALFNISPAMDFARPASSSYTPQAAGTLLSLHCALTV